MVSLVFAESALEIVPRELQHHNSVKSHARKLGKRPSEILLDNSWHYAAMKGLENEIKRGRPDIIHFSLLEATSIPLYYENKIQIYIHTIDDKVIRVGRNVNLPKSYHRFQGVFEKLFQEKKVESSVQPLLELQNMTFAELLEETEPSKVIGLTKEGTASSYSNVASLLDEDACLVIGGFQKGHFTESTKKCIDELYRIDGISLESHVVTSRILYEYEKTIFM